MLPVFLLILFAGFEFARICRVRNAANNAACQAARRIMVSGATVADANAEVTCLVSVFWVEYYSVTEHPSPVALATDRVTVSRSIPAEQCGWNTPRIANAIVIRAVSTLYAERDLTC